MAIGSGAVAPSTDTMSGLIRPMALAHERLLPVLPALAGLLPEGGLRRGSTVLVGQGDLGQGATSVALALMSAASAAGSWCGVVGLADLGLVAAAEAGLDLSRVTLVPHVATAQWATVVSVLIDSVDVVLASPPSHLRLGDARRLTTRARERQAVLIAMGSWPEGADLRLRVEGSRWHGPGAGEGRLVRRRVEVTTNGRGAAARPRRQVLWLPAEDGAIAKDSAAFAGADVESGAADAALVEPAIQPVVDLVDTITVATAG
jgi:hypothetical protein